MNIFRSLLSTVFVLDVVIATNNLAESQSKTASAAEPQYLNFVVSEPLTLSRIDQANIGTYIPFILNPPNTEVKSRFEFKILQLTAKGLSDAMLRDIASLSVVPSNSDHGPALTLLIDATKLTRSNLGGDYTLLLDVIDKSAEPVGANAALHQQRTFHLVRPAAKLDVPQLYVATQVLQWNNAIKATMPRLVVREVSGDSDIDRLTLADVSIRADATKLTTSRLEANQQRINSSAFGAFALTANGPFPLGETEGKLELNAPELATPVVVPYKIRASRPLFSIFVAGAVGLAFGYFSRSKLVARKALLEAQMPAEDLQATIADAKKQYPDKSLLKRLDEISKTLLQTRNEKAIDKIAAAVATANKDFSAALAEYKARLSDCQKRLAEVQFATSTGWRFPSVLEQRVQDIRAKFTEVEALLTQGNASDADNKLTETIANASINIASDSHDWFAALKDCFLLLKNPSAPLPDSIQSTVQHEVENLPSLPANELNPGSTSTEFATWLKSLSIAFVAAERLARQVANNIKLCFTEPIQVLRRSPKLASAAESVETATGKLTDSVAQMAADPQSSSEPITTQLSDLKTNLDALCNLVTDASAKSEVSNLLAQKRFSDAANKILAAIGPDQGPHLGEERVSLVQEPSLLSIPFAEIKPEVGQFVFPSVPAVLSPGPVADIRAKTERALSFINFLQFSIAAAIYLLFLYFTYADHFIGTLRELFTICGAAFIWDLSFDATLKKVAELKA